MIIRELTVSVPASVHFRPSLTLPTGSRLRTMALSKAHCWPGHASALTVCVRDTVLSLCATPKGHPSRAPSFLSRLKRSSSDVTPERTEEYSFYCIFGLLLARIAMSYYLSGWWSPSLSGRRIGTCLSLLICLFFLLLHRFLIDLGLGWEFGQGRCEIRLT